MTIMAAFPLSQKTFGARKGITFLFTFTMLFSGGLVPTFLTVQKLGLVDTIWALVLPGAISAWNMLIMKNYFLNSIPGELYEAARIDGADWMTILTQLVLPLSMPIVAVMVLVLRRIALEFLFQRADLSARPAALSAPADHAQLFLGERFCRAGRRRRRHRDGAAADGNHQVRADCDRVLPDAVPVPVYAAFLR